MHAISSTTQGNIFSCRRKNCQGSDRTCTSPRMGFSKQGCQDRQQGSRFGYLYLYSYVPPPNRSLQFSNLRSASTSQHHNEQRTTNNARHTTRHSQPADCSQMPPFFDAWQFHNALENQAIPQLQRLADNSNLRERVVRRFDHDNPPRYASSTASPELPPNLTQGEIDEIVGRPFSDDERRLLALGLKDFYTPGHRYKQEAKIEASRVEDLSYNYYSPEKSKTGCVLDSGKLV